MKYLKKVSLLLIIVLLICCSISSISAVDYEIDNEIIANNANNMTLDLSTSVNNSTDLSQDENLINENVVNESNDDYDNSSLNDLAVMNYNNDYNNLGMHGDFFVTIYGSYTNNPVIFEVSVYAPSGALIVGYVLTCEVKNKATGKKQN